MLRHTTLPRIARGVSVAPRLNRPLHGGDTNEISATFEGLGFSKCGNRIPLGNTVCIGGPYHPLYRDDPA